MNSINTTVSSIITEPMHEASTFTIPTSLRKKNLSNKPKNINNNIPVGTIVAYAGDLKNINEQYKNGEWLFCDGGLLHEDYKELRKVLGGIWDPEGKGRPFKPDLQGRSLRGFESPETLKEKPRNLVFNDTASEIRPNNVSVHYLIKAKP